LTSGATVVAAQSFGIDIAQPMRATAAAAQP
jgi:hypothetical protein